MTTTTGDERGIFDMALRHARSLKETIVRRDGVGADLIPALMLWHAGEPQLTIFMNGDGGWDYATIITGAIAFSRCDAAVLTAEGYLRRRALDDERPMPRRGELAERFAGNDRDVDEALMVTMFSEAGPRMTAFVPYTYDGRRIAWGKEQVDTDDDSTGLLPLAATAGYAHRGNLTPMDFPELAVVLQDEDTVEAVAMFVKQEG